jgi:hypothetical protein
MSKIPDIKEAAMSFEEKLTWVNATTTVIVVLVYAWIVSGQLAATPVAEIDYQGPMVVAVIAMILLTIAGAIVTAIGTAISAEITSPGSAENLDIDRSDERDKSISRRGDLVGYYVSSVLMIGALALTMIRAEYFWIANSIFAAFIIAGLTSSAVKLVSYRRGF